MASRRDFLRFAAAGFGASMSGWMEAFAADAASHPQRRRSCILLWMSGGPSQLDTFDLKPGQANGGPYQPIATSVPGLQISEHLPLLAKHAQNLAVIRSMTTREGDHGRGTYLMRTGNLPMGAIQYPSIGSLLSKELGDRQSELPNYVAVSPFRLFNPGAFGPGFLGPQYAPLIVGEQQNFGGQPNVNIDGTLRVRDLERPTEIDPSHVNSRMDLLKDLEGSFGAERHSVVTQSHALAYERAVKLMQSPGGKAFDLASEPDRLRDAYGRTLFGQGCLLARRLVERGVPFVEVNLAGVQGAPAGWDTHGNNFDQVKALSGVLDAGWSTLMTDLRERGLLETTTIVWMGEFGRTPKINQAKGRDHWPNSFAAVLAGGGIKGGSIVGKTSADGATIEDRPVQVIDLLATVCKAVGIDYEKTNASNIGRPIRIVDKTAKPLTEVLA